MGARLLTRPLLGAAVVFLIAGSVAAAVVWRIARHQIQEAKALALNVAAEHAQDLRRDIEHNLSALFPLAALVRQGQGKFENFDEFVEHLAPLYPALTELALAPDGIIRKVAPLAGNEKAIGFDLLRDPVQRAEALLARDSGKLTLAGPLELVQGGRAVVGRLPIILKNEKGQAYFWGFAIAVMRFPHVLEAVHLARLDQQGYGYELWRLGADGGGKQRIASSGADPLEDPLAQSVQVPNATWRLSIAPHSGWINQWELALESALALLICLFAAYAAKNFLELRMHKRNLEVLVDRRTADLRAREARYRELFEANPQPMWVYDLQILRFLAVNDAAVAHYGYAREEFLAMRITDIRPQEEVGRLMQRIEAVRKDDVRAAGIWRHRKKDGSLIDVEVKAQTLAFDGRKAQIVHVNDVTERKQVEIALQESEARFRSLTEMSSDFYWESDAEHRISRRGLGSRVETESVFRRGTQVGERRWEVPYLSPDAAGWQDHKRILDARLPFRNFELSRAGSDGTERHVAISGDPVFDAAGSFTGYRGVGSDITARKQEEKLLRLEHAVARSLTEAWDASSGLKTVMRSVCETNNWGRGTFWRVDEAAGLLRFGEFWNVSGAEFERYTQGSRSVTFARGAGMVGRVWQTGEPLWVEDFYNDPRVVQKTLAREAGMRSVFVFPVVASSQILGVLAFLSRESRQPDARLLAMSRMIGAEVGQFLQRMQAEEAVRTLNAELEVRIAARTQELEIANRELEAFSYSVSHDLRAPLRAIHGFSSILQEQYAGKIDEQGRDMLRHVSSGAVRMSHLIDDLIKLARISRQQMRIEPVDLSEMAWEVIGELQAATPERRVEWVIAPGVPASGDPGLLRVVLQNLIGNSWKYSSKREQPRIEFGVADRGGIQAYFVQDNGAGFDMAQARRLFGAFQRLHSSAEFPGSGIGLATVARILQRHEGRIWAEAKAGEGAIFYFSLGDMQRAG